MYDNADFDISLHEGLGIFASIENVEYRCDEWRSRRGPRALFVVGLSGSGKTTVARKLASTAGASLVSLDGYLKRLLRSRGYDISTMEKYRATLWSHGVEEILADNPGHIVIEGGQIGWLNPAALQEHAVIVLGTSFATSTWRAILRDFERDHWEAYGTISPHVHTKFNLLTFRPIGRIMEHLRRESATS